MQALAAILHQHVLAGDAEVSRTMFDVCRYVGGANDQQPHVILGGWNDQLAALVRILGRLDACGSQQRQGVIENAAFDRAMVSMERFP